MAKQSGPGRGQLRKRGARTWRDTTNPTGPGHAAGEPEPEPANDESNELPGEHDDHPTDEDERDPELVEGGPTAGPGGGGATQSPAGAKHIEGAHGGGTRKG